MSERASDHEPMPDPINLHLGRMICRRRAHLGLSQARLGKAVGISLKQLQRYEAGRAVVAPRRLFNLAQALSVPTTFFLEGYVERYCAASVETLRAPLPADVSRSGETLSLARSYYGVRSFSLRQKTDLCGDQSHRNLVPTIAGPEVGRIRKPQKGSIGVRAGLVPR